MGIRVLPQFFRSLGDVLDDIKKDGTWPTTFVSGPSEGLSVHWHRDDVHAYVLEGETDFLDGTTGERTPVRAGDKVVIPARTLHAEGSVAKRVVYVIALPGPRMPDEFLAMQAPEALEAD